MKWSSTFRALSEADDVAIAKALKEGRLFCDNCGKKAKGNDSHIEVCVCGRSDLMLFPEGCLLGSNEERIG